MHRLKDMTLDVEDFSKIIIIFLVRFITLQQEAHGLHCSVENILKQLQSINTLCKSMIIPKHQ